MFVYICEYTIFYQIVVSGDYRKCSQAWQAWLTGGSPESGDQGFGTNGQRSWNGGMWAMWLYGYSLGNAVVPPNSSYSYCEFYLPPVSCSSARAFAETLTNHAALVS